MPAHANIPRTFSRVRRCRDSTIKSDPAGGQEIRHQQTSDVAHFPARLYDSS